MVGRINNDQNDGTDRDASTQGSSPRAPGEKRGRTESRSKRGPANRPFTEDTPWPIDVVRQQSTPNQIIKNQNTKRTKKKESKKQSTGDPKRGRQAIVAPCVEECMTDAGRWRTQLRLIGSGREDGEGKQEESHGGPSLLVSIIILGNHNY
ncbi:uncharacterized protein BO88DRAFT_246653 [Aspergillus vadensis CBS 113365]|uniref:Uncharacterized protein n=1 Tax=Aspergillus vadensis (strain CBS 113365 / IMI 142717 / IBT 24658) TaxID=1448311 RepID=A0A319CSE4_ASPVC|nr:hypothetical protein BO88DRAFT_246653 [Aspergillus vadensis CBS 113365]PYH71172.1 hypothetical protein BO88DRAFT_246653 [Aspergillus vadensis CBS 113365]